MKNICKSELKRLDVEKFMNTCAVIVSFNPDKRLSENVNSLSRQVDKIIIVDNGSNSAAQLLLRDLEGNATILYNKSNLGLATALNQGVQLALSATPLWIITFDQDSIAPTGFMENLISTYESCPYAEQVALIGAIYQDQVSGQIVSMATSSTTSPYQPIMYTWTSGCLMKASVFSSVGYFRDDFFIDCIDVEYCLRCQSHGLKVIESNKAVLLHNLGQPIQKWFLGRSYTVRNYSPLRRYYNARNRIRVYLEYGSVYPTWVLKDVSTYVMQLLKMIVLEDKRWLKLRRVLYGFRDGFRNKGGAYPTYE